MSIPDPKETLNIAVKQVPAIRYAIGVAGIAGVIAIILSWGLNPIIIVVGLPMMIFLMMALVLFVQFSDRIGEHARLPIVILVWAAVFYIISAPVLCIVIVFTQKPTHLYEFLTLSPKPIIVNSTIPSQTNLIPIKPPEQTTPPPALVNESRFMDVTVPWNGSTQSGRLTYPIDSKYEYVTHKILEKSKNGNSSYIDRGLIGNEVVVEYSVSPQGSIFDQKRSWLELELQVTLRQKRP
jgi:hypothetical protein